jgi:hypothetical protein
MGTEVGRIEKEFVFKSLVDDRVPCDLHASRREFPCRFSGIDEDRLEMSPLEGTLEGLAPGEVQGCTGPTWGNSAPPLCRAG